MSTLRHIGPVRSAILGFMLVITLGGIGWAISASLKDTEEPYVSTSAYSISDDGTVSAESGNCEHDMQKMKDNSTCHVDRFEMPYTTSDRVIHAGFLAALPLIIGGTLTLFTFKTFTESDRETRMF